MQLPNSTVSTESSALALQLGIPAGAPANAQSRSGQSNPSSDAKFDQVIDGLAPRERENSRAKSLGAAPDPTLCPAPFVAPAPSAGDALLEGFEFDANAVASHETCAGVDGEVTINLEMRATQADLPALKVAPRTGAHTSAEDETKAAALGHFGVVAAHAALENSRNAIDANDHASAVAGGTPRFTGLPTPALENRTPQDSPPGLARLMELSDGTDPGAQTSDGQSAPINDEPASNAFPGHPRDSIFGNRPTNWPGASADNHETAFPVPGKPNGLEGRTVAPGTDLPKAKFNAAPNGLATATGHDTTANPSGSGASQLPDWSIANGRATAGPRNAIVATEAPPVPASTNSNGNTLAVTASQVAGLASQAAGATAKFAVARNEDQHARNLPPGAMDKSFVANDKEEVRSEFKVVGIGGAKTDANMLARFLPAPAQHPASEYAGMAVAATPELTDFTPGTETHSAESVASAHEAVEVVLRTAEQATVHGQKSVNLQFTVGDTDLSVRVQLHAGEVRATFRTDSSELRAALSYEWQAIANSNAGDRSMRIVPAMFAASEHSAFNASAGDTSSRQREHSADSPLSSAFAVTRSRAAAVAAPSSSPNGHVSAAASITSRHLHTVA